MRILMWRSGHGFGQDPTIINAATYLMFCVWLYRYISGDSLTFDHGAMFTYQCMLAGQDASRICSPSAHMWWCPDLAAGSLDRTGTSCCHQAPCCPHSETHSQGCQGHCRSLLSWLKVFAQVRRMLQIAVKPIIIAGRCRKLEEVTHVLLIYRHAEDAVHVKDISFGFHYQKTQCAWWGFMVIDICVLILDAKMQKKNLNHEWCSAKKKKKKRILTKT